MNKAEHPEINESARKTAPDSLSPGNWAFRLIAYGLFLVVIVVILYGVRIYSYPLYHALVELITVAIAFSLAILTWNARNILENEYLKIIGIGYAACACIDLVHTLAFKGMNIFPVSSASNLQAQLWIAARYLQALTLVAAPLACRRKPAFAVAVVFYLFTVTLLISAVFAGMFPECYR